MIKTLLLIFMSATTWERIAHDKRKSSFIIFFYLVPLMVLSLAGEVWGLTHPAKGPDGVVAHRISQQLLIRYAAAEFLSGLALVFAGAQLIKTFAQTFHPRNTYAQGFTVAAYSLGPLFLLRMGDTITGINPWITFSIGIILSIGVMYHGIPSVLEPDPPHTFGLYLISALMILMISVLVRLLTLMLLAGKFKLGQGL